MLDWDDLRFFLAIARHGSLTAAARDLRVAQSTVGRRLSSLEASLGVRLLHRTPEGYTLTLAGQDVLNQAERVEVEALGVERSVGGRDGCERDDQCRWRVQRDGVRAADQCELVVGRCRRGGLHEPRWDLDAGWHDIEVTCPPVLREAGRGWVAIAGPE